MKSLSQTNEDTVKLLVLNLFIVLFNWIRKFVASVLNWLLKCWHCCYEIIPIYLMYWMVQTQQSGWKNDKLKEILVTSYKSRAKLKINVQLIISKIISLSMGPKVLLEKRLLLFSIKDLLFY